jgi:RecJ-like exonuclease
MTEAIKTCHTGDRCANGAKCAETGRCRRYPSQGRVVACKWCGRATNYTATQECDPCHQTVLRVQHNPELARQVLVEMGFVHLPSVPVETPN